MSRKSKMDLIDLEIDPKPVRGAMTGLAGLLLVAQTFRVLGLARSVDRHIHLKQRDRGFTEAEMVESLVLLQAAGGDALDDLDKLRGDKGGDRALEKMLGHQVPGPDAARKFLYRFHSDDKMKAAKEARSPGQLAFIPQETEVLEGLGQVNQDLVKQMGRRMPEQRIATVDQDATIQMSRNKEALPTYEGGRGYQPMVTVWAETGLSLADEYRDGNVPAGMSVLPAAKRAFAMLPPSVKELYYRGDSASYQWELLGWLRNEDRKEGPKGPIGFAISADMSIQLRAAIVELPEGDWKPYKAPGHLVDALKDWAEVPYVPTEATEHKDSPPLRYLSIRIRPRQGELFADGTQVKYFAVVSNRWDLEGARLLQWQRQKAGTIELLHDVTKNELGGGVSPCQRFGANAAWFRIALLTNNVLVALKRIALPAELLDARPKRLRFEVFVHAGRLVQHARTVVLRLSGPLARVSCLLAAWHLLAAPA